jgi:rare lipoprotein A (peptidoglycan hydrolase)
MYRIDHKAIIILSLLWSAAAHGQNFELEWRRLMARPPNPGIASFYSDKLTSTGERLRPWARDDLTCASPEEPMGTRLRVCHGDRCIVCRVADIGPHPRLRRRIDLTPRGFEMLGLRLDDGLGFVTLDRE